MVTVYITNCCQVRCTGKYGFGGFGGLPLVKIHSSIPIDTHKIQAVAPDNTWEILSHPNGGQNHEELA